MEPIAALCCIWTNIFAGKFSKFQLLRRRSVPPWARPQYLGFGKEGMDKSPVQVVGESKIDEALQLMQSALSLLDEVECDSAALLFLDQAIAVLGKDLKPAACPPC